MGCQASKKTHKLIVNGIVLFTIFVLTVNMKYSLISVMEYRFGIFFLEAPVEIHSLDFEPILLFPSKAREFEISLPKMKEGDFIYLNLALSALSTYFFKVRGLPLEEIEICHSVSNFALKNSPCLTFKDSKCKYEFAKCDCELKGVNLEYTLCGEVLFFESKNIEFFDSALLPALSLKVPNKHVGAVAYSLNDEFCRVKRWSDEPLLSVSLMILSLFVSEKKTGLGDWIEFIFENGEKVSLLKERGGFFKAAFENQHLGFFEYNDT